MNPGKHFAPRSPLPSLITPCSVWLFGALRGHLRPLALFPALDFTSWAGAGWHQVTWPQTGRLGKHTGALPLLTGRSETLQPRGVFSRAVSTASAFIIKISKREMSFDFDT